jgi:hypothetical protein
MEETTEVVESPQTDNISDVSTDDLRNALGTVVEDSNVQDSEIAETEEQTATEPTGEVSEEPEGTEIQELGAEETEEDRLAKRRVRPRNQMDQQVIDLYRSSGFEGSFADASSIIYGTNVQNAQPEPATQQSEPEVQAPTYEDKIGGIKGEVAELETKINEANEELDTTLALKLQRDVFRKELEISKLENQQQRELENQQYQAEESQRQKALESRGRAVEMYPDLDDNNSVYRKEFDHFLSQSEQNPDYAVIFSSPRWCEIMANEFAIIKGVSANTQKQAQPQAQPQAQQQQVQPQMGNQAKVLTTGQTAQPVNTPTTANGLIQDLPNMSNSDIYSLLGSSGGRQPLQ